MKQPKTEQECLKEKIEASFRAHRMLSFVLIGMVIVFLAGLAVLTCKLFF